MPDIKRTLIKNGSVVDGESMRVQDILVEGEKIKTISRGTDISADSTIDATGLLVLPGAIDTHVHFNDEFIYGKNNRAVQAPHPGKLYIITGLA